MTFSIRIKDVLTISGHLWPMLPYIEATQLISRKNQLTVFYMLGNVFLRVKENPFFVKVNFRVTALTFDSPES